jgi:hypothetical protein
MAVETPTREQDSPTLAFDEFWRWLVLHPNCIVRAGTADSVLYDDDDLHWHFGNEGPDAFLCQLIRGKRLLGEMVIRPDTVSYVQGYRGDHEDEFVFEMIAEGEEDRAAAYFFVLSHAFDAPETPTTGRAVH